MAAEPISPAPSATTTRLEPFDPHHAACVAAWVQSPREAYWLAPHSTPPISAGTVLDWAIPGRRAYQLAAAGADDPVAYGELNVLNDKREFWLGHLIVAPAQRRRGFGVRLVRSLVRCAFEQFAAQRLTLVVFEHNEDAIACYEAAGLRNDGSEVHRFPAYGTTETLRRMVAPAPHGALPARA